VQDVALFPIPGSVTFPGIPCPLHVFEPRYRQMVRHCVESGMPMGVCHTEKVLHANERSQTTDEALRSNQSTYKPRTVFSAGPVSLLHELDDGRLMISVETDKRLVLKEERQTLPFSIWRCEELVDAKPDDDTGQRLSQYKEKILNRLIALTHGQPDIQERLRGEHWQDMPVEAFSFAISGSIGMDPELAQYLLETTDTLHRLDTLLQLINGDD